MATNHTVFQNVQLAITAYAQERWTEAKRINTSGIVAGNQNIDSTGESFIGQFRWVKPTVATINNASLTDSTDGTYSTISTEISNYVKSSRSQGFEIVNLQKVISQKDGLAIYANSVANNRAEDENNAITSVLKGVAAYEAGVGAGVVDFDTVPSGSVGAFVDLNAAGAFGDAATGSSDSRRLVDSSGTTAKGAQNLFRALGMFYKDYEPEYVYMVTDPEVYSELRILNLIDDDRVTDGSIEFQTIFNGKFRLLGTRAVMGDLSGSANVNDESSKTTFLVAPGAVAWENMPHPMPTELDRDPAAYLGGGVTKAWYRHGFVAHPMGYNWVGASDDFATNADFTAAASWERKADPLNLGILPIFHA